MNLQIIDCSGGVYQVVFAPESNARKIAKNLRDEENGEKLVGFISLEKSDDSAIEAFAAIGALAVDSNHSTSKVPLETILTKIFLAGLEYGVKKTAKK